MDSDYIRSNRYPGTVWAEKIHEHLLEAPAKIIKFHTRLRDSINAPPAQTIQDDEHLIHNSR
ncbi:TPA: hypothetical protein JBE46_11640 [Legionella pneumophila subsp. pneumophila]|nr:hypothetical protein D7214_12610 [Legionella pneumophila]HAT8831633.1 hypothetical protein [Legionella pneumophila subsp. pneumophila]TIE24510.1 hypothetical protein DIZ48_13885 [Legionella pneumophila]TIE44983.1 hypothetical protein DIZ50_13435 [Legionella pneumophila]HAT8336006.1 hypothetical protein [Legionella pneumophila]